MNIKHVSTLIALAAACTGAAHAGFVVEDAGAVPAGPRAEQAAQASDAGLTQIGAPRSEQPAARGEARGVALATALKQIVPPGWRGKRAGGLDVDRLVSWRGDGRAWTVVLQELATKYRFNVLIDWEKNEVTVAPASFQASQSEGFREITSVAPAAAAPAKTWRLDPKHTLRENIEAWGKSVGWTVSWAAVDYRVGAEVVLSGSFDDEVNGPLLQVARAYQEQAEKPITFRFYTNHVVRVENSSYSQVNVNPQPANNRAMQ